MMIKDFKEKDVIDMPLLIKSYSKGITNNGEPYLTIEFQDKSGKISSKFWKVSEDIENIVEVGKIVIAKGDIIEYNKSIQFRVKDIKEIDQNLVNLNDFLITSDISEKDLKDGIEYYINSILNPIYKDIVSTIFNEVGDIFYKYPAASKIHHSFVGGLAFHIISMCKLADSICGLYPELDRDLLISGVLLHDVGKMIEISGPVKSEYTLEGKLLGHISIMNGKVSKVIDELNVGDSEEAILIRHMILSHHGHYEYGSPVLPLTREAEVLYYIDNIDARLNTLKEEFNKTKAGSFTQRIFALDNRAFYKQKNSK